MANDEVQAVSLKLTEEDIRRDCAEMKIPYSALMAVARRHKAQQTASSIADVLYIMMLAKSNGLNPIADNYSLIPRPGGQGFSLTFNKSAALHVILNHPKVKKGASLRRFIITGKGERIDLNEHPELAPGRWQLANIDWNLTAVCEIEAEAGGVLRGSAKYGNCFAAGNDGNPKFLWLKSPTEMTMKQAQKDLANTHLDGSLPDEDAIGAAQLAEADAQPTRALPAATGERTYVPDAEPASKNGDEVDLSELIAVAGKCGVSQPQAVALYNDREANGMTLESLIAAFQKQVDAATAKADKRPTQAPKVEDAPPATAAPAAASEPEKPAAQSEEAPKRGRQRKEPKPVIRVDGFIDAIAEKSKALPPKPGEPDRKQPYLAIVMNKMDMTVYHKSFFDDMYEAFEASPQKKVRIGYIIDGSGDQEYARVEEFAIIDEPQAPEEEPKSPGFIAAAVEVSREIKEAEEKLPAASGNGLLFNF